MNTAIEHLLQAVPPVVGNPLAAGNTMIPSARLSVPTSAPASYAGIE